MDTAHPSKPVIFTAIWIEALLANGATQKFIAQRYGTTESNLSNWLKKYGLRRNREYDGPKRVSEKG